MNCGQEEVPNNVALHDITFASKSLSGTERWYSNIEREAVGILLGLIISTITALQRKYM